LRRLLAARACNCSEPTCCSAHVSPATGVRWLNSTWCRDLELIKHAVAAPVGSMSTLSAAARATLLRADVLQAEA